MPWDVGTRSREDACELRRSDRSPSSIGWSCPVPPSVCLSEDNISKESRSSRRELCWFVLRRFLGDGSLVLNLVLTLSRELLEARAHRFSVGQLSGLITPAFGWARRKDP